MAYIDYEYYTDLFGSTDIAKADFERLAQIASDVIDNVAVIQFRFDELGEDEQALVKKATAYEVETLDSQGGVSAIVGQSSQSINSEQLGDYRISSGSTAQSSVNLGNIPFMEGIPISPLAIGLLRRAGLMNRWTYAGYRDHRYPPEGRCP